MRELAVVDGVRCMFSGGVRMVGSMDETYLLLLDTIAPVVDAKTTVWDTAIH
jgi:hypothetical protein